MIGSRDAGCRAVDVRLQILAGAIGVAEGPDGAATLDVGFLVPRSRGAEFFGPRLAHGSFVGAWRTSSVGGWAGMTELERDKAVFGACVLAVEAEVRWRTFVEGAVAFPDEPSPRLEKAWDIDACTRRTGYNMAGFAVPRTLVDVWDGRVRLTLDQALLEPARFPPDPTVEELAAAAVTPITGDAYGLRHELAEFVAWGSEPVHIAHSGPRSDYPTIECWRRDAAEPTLGPGLSRLGFGLRCPTRQEAERYFAELAPRRAHMLARNIDRCRTMAERALGVSGEEMLEGPIPLARRRAASAPA